MPTCSSLVSKSLGHGSLLVWQIILGSTNITNAIGGQLEKAILISLLFFSKDFYVFIFRERRREGERGGEKHQLIASHSLPNGEPGPPPRHVLQQGIEPVTLQFCKPAFNPLSHTSQGRFFSPTC